MTEERTGPPAGVIATHRMFHQGPGDFTARPDFCDDCRGASLAAERLSPAPPSERVRHPEAPPTYRELRRRAGTPLADQLPTLLEERFPDRMRRAGLDLELYPRARREVPE